MPLNIEIKDDNNNIIIIINKLDSGHIYFESLSVLNVKITLYSYKKDIELFSTDMHLEIGNNYYISHPSITCLDVIYIIFHFDNETYSEFRIDEDLLKVQECHILNFYSKEDYNMLEPYINWSFYEIVKEDNYGLKNNKLLLPSDKINVVDLGANIGTFGKYLQIMNININKYIAVEPNHKLNNALDINLSSTLNYEIINKAISDNNDSEISMDFPINIIDSPLSKKSIKNVNNKVETIKFCDIISKIPNGERIHILKIDIEGAEKYLLDSETINLMQSVVDIIIIETHGDLDDVVVDKMSVYFDIVNTNDICGYKHHFMINKSKNTNKKILVKVSCPALGDTICSTPTIRKVSKSYGHKIDVMTKRKDVFIKNKYVNNILDHNENLDISLYDEVFETYNQHIKVNKNMGEDFYEKPIEIKLSNFEARQFHAMGIGISLYPDEMEYDYIPDIVETDDAKKVDKNTIILHITENWPSRTWEVKKWQRLVNLIKNNTDLKIVTIGKSHIEDGYFGNIVKNIIPLDNIDYNFCDDNVGHQKDSSTLRPISEMWHIINNSLMLISFDSGPIHLAGTTDTHIVQIGSSIRYEKTAPYRNGSQDYKFHFLGGDCKIFCASDPKYSVKEWGSINTMPYYPECQENYTEFKCQPMVDDIFFKIIEIYKYEK